jgi:hypothetical protein
MRPLDDVLFHEDHKPRAEIQYEGSSPPWLKAVLVEAAFAKLV